MLWFTAMQEITFLLPVPAPPTPTPTVSVMVINILQTSPSSLQSLASSLSPAPPPFCHPPCLGAVTSPSAWQHQASLHFNLAPEVTYFIIDHP